MSEEKKKAIREFGETLSDLPENEQSYIIGRIEGYKKGLEDGKKESEKK